MSRTALSTVHEKILSVCQQWPREAWDDSEKAALALTRRMARAVGHAEVEHCMASVDKQSPPGVFTYSVAVITADLVVAGTLAAGPEMTGPRRAAADVFIVPRSAVRSLTVHHVDQDDSPSGVDIVVFTAEYPGMPPLKAVERSNGQYDGSVGALFDALRADLAATGRG
mgnify:CR=1 FL=1